MAFPIYQIFLTQFFLPLPAASAPRKICPFTGSHRCQAISQKQPRPEQSLDSSSFLKLRVSRNEFRQYQPMACAPSTWKLLCSFLSMRSFQGLKGFGFRLTPRTKIPQELLCGNSKLSKIWGSKHVRCDWLPGIWLTCYVYSGEGVLMNCLHLCTNFECMEFLFDKSCRKRRLHLLQFQRTVQEKLKRLILANHAFT